MKSIGLIGILPTRAYFFAFLLCLIAASPARAQTDASVRLSPEVWESMLPVLSEYRRMVLEYNENPGANSPWFAESKVLDIPSIIAGPSVEDKKVLELWKLVSKSMERMRGAHELLRVESVQMFSRGTEMGPLQITMLQTMTLGVAHAYDEWVAAHEGLIEILRARKGYRLAKPYPPLLLREMRAVAFPGAGQ